MKDATSSCSHWEAHQLYRSWLLADNAAENAPQPPACRDKNLHAIAQLAAIRLRAQHAIISILDNDSQHILAEATQDLPLSDEPTPTRREPLLGVTSLPSSEIFCDPRILADPTSPSGEDASSRLDHFVSTNCESDDRFKDHALVKKEGGIRFAAGVPLISKNDCVVGVVLVLADTPRESVEDTGLVELKDCAQCVIRHLELVRLSVEPRRENNVLREISGCFADQYHLLPEEKQKKSGIPKGSESDNDGQDKPATVTFEADGTTDVNDTRWSIETSLQTAFDTAARILRESAEADGAVIFGPPAVADLMVIDDNTSTHESDEQDTHNAESILLASSLWEGFSYPAKSNQPAPTMDTLHSLVSVYPRGKIFDLTRHGGEVKSSPIGNRHLHLNVPPIDDHADDDAHEQRALLAKLHEEILTKFGKARTLVFLPVYDQETGALLATCLIWNISNTYAASTDWDIEKFHVLGNFLSHSVAQLRTQNKDAEQKKFMSNFSHELRTPINGILGAAQFLQDTVSDDYQNELLQSIVVSSNTLLDTLNIVLDYTKFEHAISEIKEPRVEEGPSSALSVPVQPFYVDADIDLALLIEDATETVVAGHFFDNLPPEPSTPGVIDRSYDNYRTIQGIDRGTNQDVKVILRISARPSWSVKTSPGAISRIIMNVVGNALKFTSTGTIVVDLEPKANEDASRVNVRINVIDSGIGMTEHFMKHHLFAPFRQGNPFSPGVGLGMSVLKHMVSSLDGDLKISSTVGEGTAVGVDLTFAASENPHDGIPADLTSILSRLKGKHLVLLDFGVLKDKKPKDAVVQRVVAIESVATNWLDMRVSRSSDIDVPDADFYLFSEPPSVDEVLEHHQKAVETNAANVNMEVPLVVVATDSREAHMINRNHAVSIEKTGRIVQVLSQPCGPRKLAKVLNLCQDRVEQSKKDRACKEDVHGSSAEHKPSESEPESHSSHYGDDGVGKRMEDPSGPPKASEERAPPKSTSDNSTEGRGDQEPIQQHAQDEDQNIAERIENGGSHPEPESSAPKPLFSKPLVLSRDPKEATPTIPQTPKERNLYGLCVDDNKINLRLLVTLMRKEKHTYEQAENGQEALDIFIASNGVENSSDDAHKPFDFVLMDIGMPVMNGIQCTKAIREYERKHDLTPTYIVACTAWGDVQTQREAKEAGMDAFLPKPLKFAHLKGLLADLMKSD